MIRDFGVLLAIGVIVLVIVGIVCRPPRSESASGPSAPTSARNPPSRSWSSSSADSRRRPASPIVVLATILFVGGVLVEGRTKIQSDPVKWIDQSSETVTDIDRLAEETDFASTLGVLVAANNVFDQEVVDLIYEFTVDAEARPDRSSRRRASSARWRRSSTSTAPPGSLRRRLTS